MTMKENTMQKEYSGLDKVFCFATIELINPTVFSALPGRRF